MGGDVMKKSTLVRLMPALLLSVGVLMSAACSNYLSCEGSQRQLPARWVEAKFPLVEGGSICSYGEDKNTLITYDGVEYFEVYDKYAERLKADGWRFTLSESERTFLAAEKNGKSFAFGFRDCEKILSTCSHVNVTAMPDP
jgi:hypothetical protein